LPAGRINFSMFASPGDSLGHPYHYHESATFIIPLRGPKHLDLGDNPEAPFPLDTYGASRSPRPADLYATRGHAPASGPSKATRVVLKPGKAVLMPHGCWHATEHPGESLSLTIFIDWPRLADLVAEHVRSQLLRHDEWREPAFGAWSPDREVRADAAGRLENLLQGLVTSIGETTPEDVLLHVADDNLAAYYLSDDVRYVPVPAQRYIFERNAEQKEYSELRIESKHGKASVTVSIGKHYVPICRWLAARKRRFTLHELVLGSGAKRHLAIELLQVLSASEVVCRVPFRETPRAPRSTKIAHP
jgi:hypothetical protein